MRQGEQQAHPDPMVDEQEKIGQDGALTATIPDTPPVSSVLQALSPATTSTRRLMVILPEKKRAKKAAGDEVPGKRLSPRLRQTIVIVFTLVLLGGTLTTLAPLASEQGGWNLSTGLGTLLQTARTDLQSLIPQQNSQPSTGSTKLPPMTIPHSQLVTLAEQDATAAGISPVYFVRQINLESGFNPNAVSVTNAQGIAQFEPYTAGPLGINPWDPVQALRGAANLMGGYYHQYGNYAKALAAYNAGPGGVQSASYSCGMNWLSCMPGQTQDYVYKIMGV